MDECNAALVLMSLSGSPHSPRQWMFSSSPGSSNASWTSGSEELSDEGAQTGSISPNRMRTTSLSTSDEGIVMDYSDETPRKRRVSTHYNSMIYCCYPVDIFCCCFFCEILQRLMTRYARPNTKSGGVDSCEPANNITRSSMEQD